MHYTVYNQTKGFVKGDVEDVHLYLRNYNRQEVELYIKKVFYDNRWSTSDLVIALANDFYYPNFAYQNNELKPINHEAKCFFHNIHLKGYEDAWKEFC